MIQGRRCSAVNLIKIEFDFGLTSGVVKCLILHLLIC